MSSTLRSEADYVADEYQSEMYANGDHLQIWPEERDEDRWAQDYDQYLDGDALDRKDQSEQNKAFFLIEEMDQRDQDVRIDGSEPMMVQSLIDDRITRKYHARLLNVWRDKAGLLSVGSVRIETHHEWPIAFCVRCKATIKFQPKDDAPIREQMEDWTAAIIRHGNNHGSWRNRKYQIQQPWPRGYAMALPLKR